MDANGIGTDATMAEHIEKVVSRGYVVKQNQGGARGGNSLPIMIPSNLGIALVESYDEIGFDMALTKPFLRKETEEMMKKICEGQLTKEQFLQQTLQQYREAFALANRQKDILITTVKRHL